MEKSVLIAGFGGQGVMSIGKMLGYAASDAGKFASFYPSYGAEQRGGTANCTVIISDEEIGSPAVSKLDVLIAMNEPSYQKFSPKVKKGGSIVINSSMVSSKVEDKDINAYYIHANEMANELGSPLVANIIILGAYLGVSNALSEDQAKAIIKKMLGSKPGMLEINYKAFDKGFEAVNKSNDT